MAINTVHDKHEQVAPRYTRPARRIKLEREPRRMGGFMRFLQGLLSFTFLALIAAGVVSFLLHSTFDAPGPLNHATVAVIPKGEGIYDIAGRLEKEGVAMDIANHRDAPASFRIWAGATIEASDLAALTPWLDWGYAIERAALAKAA